MILVKSRHQELLQEALKYAESLITRNNNIINIRRKTVMTLAFIKSYHVAESLTGK